MSRFLLLLFFFILIKVVGHASTEDLALIGNASERSNWKYLSPRGAFKMEKVLGTFTTRRIPLIVELESVRTSYDHNRGVRVRVPWFNSTLHPSRKGHLTWTAPSAFVLELREQGWTKGVGVRVEETNLNELKIYTVGKRVFTYCDGNLKSVTNGDGEEIEIVIERESIRIRSGGGGYLRDDAVCYVDELGRIEEIVTKKYHTKFVYAEGGVNAVVEGADGFFECFRVECSGGYVESVFEKGSRTAFQWKDFSNKDSPVDSIYLDQQRIVKINEDILSYDISRRGVFVEKQYDENKKKVKMLLYR